MDNSRYSVEEVRNMVQSSLGVVNSNTCFIQVPNSFIRREDLSINEKMMYMYLWGYGIDRRPSYPSHDKIAKHLNIGRSTVIRTLKTLEEKGGLYILNRYNKETKAKTTNLYYLAEIDNNNGSFIDSSLEIVKRLYPNKIAYI